MKASFQILTQPWIPVKELDGTMKELSLLETLERAHLLSKIQDPSPMVEYSVYRFLIVFLMDMLRPEDEEALEELLDDGQFDRETIQSYVRQCEQEGVSFDLFDPERPFLQTNYRADWDRDPKPVSTLDYSIPNGNNHIHFDHKREKVIYTPGKALRMMLAAQIFCTRQGRGYAPSVNDVPPWFVLICGNNLFETLIYNMLGLNRISVKFDDPPVIWRSTAEIDPSCDIIQTSWMFGMLFPARRIRLLQDIDGNVSQVYFNPGLHFIGRDFWTDPHVTYLYNEKGCFNWKPSADEAIWRNLTDLIDTKGKRAPQIIAQYEKLDTSDRPMTLVIYGVQTNQANYMRAQRHDLQIPKKLLGNENALRFITEFVTQAERLGRALYKALTLEEIPEESRVQARQRYYAVCEQILWSQFDALAQPGSDYAADLTETINWQCRTATECVDWTLEQLTLRGRAMLQVMDHQQKVLGKEIAAIKKGMKT